MKLQLDTTHKTIKIEENVNLNELYEMLEKILPNGNWKEYKLETHSEIIWNSPIVIRDRQYPYPWYGTTANPSTYPTYPTYNHGVYNIQC